MNVSSWQQLIEPKLLILIPVLNFIATFMKKKGADSCKIPLRLGLCGIFLAVCYELAVTPIGAWGDLFTIVFSGITQGLLCAAGAVYLHQLKHQKEKSNAERAGATQEKTEPPKENTKQ